MSYRKGGLPGKPPVRGKGSARPHSDAPVR
jgi:hypothetical protein